ncbi:hypothetical protein J2X69_005124 [Algoriphagus sp. 4150]|nr:hypothetical protein [Algoriphagus sp. 4150]
MLIHYSQRQIAVIYNISQLDVTNSTAIKLLYSLFLIHYLFYVIKLILRYTKLTISSELHLYYNPTYRQKVS